MRKNILQIAAIILLLIATVNIVKAEIELGTPSTPIASSCCAKLSNGAICQEGITETEVQQGVTCETGWLQTSCNEVSDCRKGCCYDQNQGLCSSASPKGICELGGGSWTEDLSCTTNQCQKNCCILGDNANYVTQKTCEVLSRGRGQEMNYVTAANENACFQMVGLQKKGACVYEKEETRLCKFGTKEECTKINGAFSENLLCSNPSLNNTCKKQAKTACVEGLDEVYWFDDCTGGISNRENIFEGNSESQKLSAYNNGTVKLKQESCTVSTSNINTQCGNCDKNIGTKCSMNTQGNAAFCKSLNCPNAPNTIGNQTRRNGESWCVYESQIGGGKDVPGSRHYKYSCVEGEVITEGCGDYRSEVCSEEQVSTQHSNYSKAVCRTNLANECLNYNKIKKTDKRVETCMNNSDCYMHISSFEWKAEESGSVSVGHLSFNFDDFKEDMTSGKGLLKGFLTGGGLGTPGPGSPGFSLNKPSDPSIIPDVTFPSKDSMILNYKICLPQYPIAYKKPTEETKKVDKKAANPNICSRGNFRCLGTECGDLDVITKFADNMANMCISIGDCGPSTNIAGNFTKSGYKITGTKTKISNKESNKLKSYYKPTNNIKIESSEFVKKLLPNYYTSTSKETYNSIEPPKKSILKLLKIKTDDSSQKFVCDYWQQPIGGEACDKCDDNPLRQCTKYRCSSLGSTCQLLNEGTTDQTCVSIKSDDNTVPVISPLNELLNSSYRYLNPTNMRVELKTSDGNCLPENTLITIPIKTDEPAKCLINEEHTDSFDEEGEYIGKDSSFVFNHTFSTVFPSADNIVYGLISNTKNLQNRNLEDLEKQINEQYNSLNYYVRCQDVNGKADIEEYIVNTCIKPEPDTTPPAITKMIPEKGSNIAYDTKEFQAVFYTNEQAECKWSNSSGKNYSDMENVMNCQNEIEDITSDGWLCIANLEGMNNADKNFYIKCQDKPWFKGTTKENERKANTDDFVYSVKATKTPLNITKIMPFNNQIIYGGTEQFQLTLSIDTVGGVENGKAECKFTQIKDGYATPFRYTSSTNHKQVLSPNKGNYTYYFGCQDIAGNTAFAQSSFSLQLDTSAPIVTRTFVNGGNLNVITDEDSECAYSKTSCSFDFTNATRMLGINKVHTSSELSGEITYYIRCKDKYNNPQTGCSMIVGLF